MARIEYFRSDRCGWVKKMEDQLPALRDPMILRQAGIVPQAPPPGSGIPTPSIRVNGQLIQGSNAVLPILRQAITNSMGRGGASAPSYGSYGTFGLPMTGWGSNGY